MLTANKPAGRGNYFQTGNVPQRCTAAARRAACFDSAQARRFTPGGTTGSDETEKQENRKQQAAKQGTKLRDPGSATKSGTAPIKTRNHNALTARAVPRYDLSQKGL